MVLHSHDVPSHILGLPMTPLSNEEIDDLLKQTLHGPLPAQTMHRIFASLAELAQLRDNTDAATIASLRAQLATLERAFPELKKRIDLA